MSTNISKKKWDDLPEKTHRGKIDLIYISGEMFIHRRYNRRRKS